ncbi:sensor histidine kinase [Rufibacter latericius]|uniref:histidine kinase n=1 Tax=Rufibacter latericius TaxID=2487040 RepID=A0A3M9MV97_9BACT|nr:ATP-binding protein [Rufibacter latericius]RNI28843.1 GHKL domain-containing protein [Rufibacter latericius]
MEKPTENPEAHNNLIELNDELENYFSNTVIPQLFVDAGMVLRKFTPAAMTHFSLTQEDVGRHIDEVCNNIRFPTVIENIQEVIRGGEDLRKDIQTTDRKWYQMDILPYLVRKENRVNGVIITFVDIDERVQALAGYEKLNKKYRTIIYSISHDVRGPIASMSGLVNLLKDPSTSEEDTRQIVDLLGRSAEHALKTLTDLTDIKESDSDFANAAERVNIENLIEDAQLALKDQIHETGAKVTTEIHQSEVNLSRKNVRSVIYNLLSNAIKYKAPDREPEVHIKAESSGGYTVLSVRDNGRGIEEGKREVIFERYTRLAEDVEGTGLGLFIVRNMVEEEGGKIEVESEVGKGSTFNVYFKAG